jgi:hypothetical protein
MSTNAAPPIKIIGPYGPKSGNMDACVIGIPAATARRCAAVNGTAGVTVTLDGIAIDCVETIGRAGIVCAGVGCGVPPAIDCNIPNCFVYAISYAPFGSFNRRSYAAIWLSDPGAYFGTIASMDA